MPDQLKVDLAKLGDLSGILSRLGADLDYAPTHIDSYAAGLGHQGLADATRTLSGDWNVFRRGLIADIATLGAFADQASNAYQNTDTDLAKLISDLMNPSPMPLHGRYHAEL